MIRLAKHVRHVNVNTAQVTTRLTRLVNESCRVETALLELRLEKQDNIVENNNFQTKIKLYKKQVNHFPI